MFKTPNQSSIVSEKGVVLRAFAPGAKTQVLNRMDKNTKK
jgi:hypothetical protein